MPPEDAQPGWFGRHWKWLVPLLGIGLPLLALWVTSVVIGMKVQPQIDALSEQVRQRVEGDPEIAGHLGGEMKLAGNVEVEWKDSYLDDFDAVFSFELAVVGPRGRGKVSGNGREGEAGMEISQLALHILGASRPVELPVKPTGAARVNPAVVPAAVAAVEPPREAEPPPPVRSPTRKTQSGALTLVTRPASEVRFAGKALGTTPLFKIPMKTGTHRLTLVGADGVRRSLTVPIKANEVTLLNLPLEDLAAE